MKNNFIKTSKHFLISDYLVKKQLQDSLIIQMKEPAYMIGIAMLFAFYNIIFIQSFAFK